MKKPYKAVFFDLDGVLTTNHSGSGQTNAYLAEKFDIDAALIRSVGSKYHADISLGKSDFDNFLQDLSTTTGKNIEMKDFEEAFRSTPKNEAMFDLAFELKGEDLLIGVITDNSKERFEVLKESLELPVLFDTLVTSAEVGTFKDDETIFKAALKDAGVAAKESIFIDNKQNNLAAAEAIGMHTIWFDDEKGDVESLRQELMNLL